jgi:hypothetical protein
MVKESLAKATRLKHLQVLLTLSRLLPVECKYVTKSDVENLVTKIVEMYPTALAARPTPRSTTRRF